MEVSRREIYRYMGYGNQEPDGRVKEMTERCLKELQEAVSPRFFSRTFPLTLRPESVVDFTCFQTRSEGLSRNLKGCEQVILFAATLGAGADLLIRRYSRLEMGRAVILQAAGAAMIEAYCDAENERLRKQFLEAGYFLRPRFSPGYGDFLLSAQRDMVRVLEAEKRVGITLTDGLIMVPSKSVTAVIGAGRKSAGCDAEGCVSCGKEDCPYRRTDA